MTRSSLDDAHWALLMLVIQQMPHASKRDEAALRRFVEAALWDLSHRRAVVRPAGDAGPLVQRLPPLAAVVPARLVGEGV